jgi:type VI protein secretion system component VasK
MRHLWMAHIKCRSLYPNRKRPDEDRYLEANQKLSEDDWVMGEDGKGALASATDANDIQNRYYQDYADNWKRFVQGISVKSYKNKDEAASDLSSFSDAKSPMKALLAEIARNTNLSAKPEVMGWWD